MRVAINGLAITAGMTGIGRATLGVLRAMLRHDRENEFFLFLPSDSPPELDLDAPNLACIETDVALTQPLKSMLFGEFKLPRRLRGARIDLYYSPSFLLPAFPGADAEVICVHDLAWRLFPKTKSLLFRTYMNRRLPGALKRASRIVCVSESTRQDLLKCYPRTKRDNTRVVHNGVELDVFKPDPSDQGEQPYVAVVGNQDPRKNISTLLEAFPRFRTRMRPCRLVMVGPGETPRAKPPAVDFLGYLSESALASLYRRALMVVQPSLYEGFGLPVLEAMACGTPVACADIDVFREVAGEAAAYFNPRDAKSIASTMEAIARDDDMRARLSAAGLERARCFSWDASARKLAAVFQEAVR
jgi:alpha-1,3-rhamnosyl/mannosyltransferase